VQSLLYGGSIDARDAPFKSGKKASNMAHEVKPSPFAQWNVESEEVYHQIHSRKKHGEATQSAGQYKVGGTGGFDPAVYRANIENNLHNRNSSRARAHGGGSLLSHYGQESPGDCPHASGEKVGRKTGGPVQPVMVHAMAPADMMPPPQAAAPHGVESYPVDDGYAEYLMRMQQQEA